VGMSINYVLATKEKPTWPRNLHDCMTASVCKFFSDTAKTSYRNDAERLTMRHVLSALNQGSQTRVCSH